MTEIKHKPYLDWLTFGLYWIERLADVKDPGRVTSEVFLPTTPYRIDRSDQAHAGTDLISFLSDLYIPELDKWQVLKQLSAALRYSYLEGGLVVSAYVHEDSQSTSHFVVRLARLSGPDLLLSPLRDNECVYNGDVVLQGGHPATWFDLDRWNMHKPIDTNETKRKTYPLSRPVFCDPRYSRPLARIGASSVTSTYWTPPIASASDDMFDYLSAQPVPPALDEGF